MKKLLSLMLAFVMLLSLCACAPQDSGDDQPIGDETVTVTDMIGREVTVKPGSYKRVVCIGAGALRMYTYIGDVSLLCGVEDIDNTTLAERPKMFDSVARPYLLAYGEEFSALPSCGVGGPSAQAAEAEKILACNPDIVISEFEDVAKSDALQEQLGVPVITLKAGSKGVFDEVFAGSMELLGKIFGAEEKAAALNKFVADEKAAIEAAVADIAEEDKPSVYICGLGNWGTTNHLMTAENYVSFEVAGVKNVLSGLGIQGVGAIEAEKFVDIGDEMDIMIMDAAAVKNIKPLYAEVHAYAESAQVQPAVKEHGAVTTGKNEAVAVEPAWLSGVYIEQFAIKNSADFCAAQGQTHVTGCFVVNGIDGKTSGLVGGLLKNFRIHANPSITDAVSM